MDPIPENPGAPLEPHQLSPRRIKRRLIAALIVLHAASILAAVFLVVKSKGDGPKGRGGSAKSLLNLKPKDTVGWVSIRGPIMASESGKPWERGAEQWARRIEQLAETKGVKAIVLDINSPGGSVGAVQEIYMRIQRVKKEKKIPFVALFGDVSASGGYYLGAACDKIVAHPGTITGSIGVIFSVSNLEGLFQNADIKNPDNFLMAVADGLIGGQVPVINHKGPVKPGLAFCQHLVIDFLGDAGADGPFALEKPHVGADSHIVEKQCRGARTARRQSAFRIDDVVDAIHEVEILVQQQPSDQKLMRRLAAAKPPIEATE